MHQLFSVYITSKRIDKANDGKPQYIDIFIGIRALYLQDIFESGASAH